MVVPVAVAEDVAVKPAEPDAVEELVCVAVMLHAGEGMGPGLWKRREAVLPPPQRAVRQPGTHVVVPVAVAEDVAVRPADPDAVDELVCDAVMLQEQGEGGGEKARRALIPRVMTRRSQRQRQQPQSTHVVVPVAVADEVAVRPAVPDAVEELVCEAVMLQGGQHGRVGGRRKRSNSIGSRRAPFGARSGAKSSHVVVAVAVADDVAVKPAVPEAVDELVCDEVMLHAGGAVESERASERGRERGERKRRNASARK